MLENTTSEAEILAAEKELALQKEQCALLAEAGKQGEQILEYVGAIRDNLSVVAIERIRTAKGSLMLLREQVQDVLPTIAVEKESNAKKVALLEERLENLIIES